MKRIKYNHCVQVNHGTEESPNIEERLFTTSLPYTKDNEEHAKHVSHNGEYTIYDDGQPDPADTPSQLDVIEAQVTYTAMQTGTLIMTE